jgi:oligo-1,6-glucosidase
MKKWWKEAVVYQVYPRSFADANGDGIGDLPGLIGKLDYLRDLGVDAIWMSPICQTPDRDNGYDISDYCEISPKFGTMADVDRLLAEAHRRGLKIIFDMVCNHSSDQHAWFQESKSSRTNPKRDFYIWRKGRDGKEPNNWRAEFGGSAWTLDPVTGEYYLGVFSPFQPDLNWENPAVREALYATMRWWLDKGVDGFRLDVINFISKAPGLPDVPVSADAPKDQRYFAADCYYVDQPGVHALLRELNQEVFTGRDIMVVGECHGRTLTPKTGWMYVQEDRQELDIIFHFDILRCFGERNPKAGFERIGEWQAAMGAGGWATMTLGNHDSPRQVSAMGDDGVHRVASAKALATVVLTAPGTPFLFQGEEIGMTNVAFPAMTDYRDIAARDLYESSLAAGKTPAEALAEVHRRSRDNARTPMQWACSAGAGFTTGTPWIGVNPNVGEINVAAQESDPESVLSWYRRLLQFRKHTPVLIHGSYRVLSIGEEPVCAFERSYQGVTLTVVLNWSSDAVSMALPADGGARWQELCLCNYPGSILDAGGQLKLRPWEVRVYQG